jgi:hypothetical protein
VVPGVEETDRRREEERKNRERVAAYRERAKAESNAIPDLPLGST